MKKLFYLIMIAILCLAFFACNKNKNTEETPVPSGGTLAGTQIGNSGQNTPSEFGDPDKIYYNYDASGFGITEVHLDEKGRPIKETLYTIDQTYGVIAPTMSMESTYDENNKLLRANGEYLSLSVYAPKNIKIKVSKSEDQNFGYEISQKEGFVSAYINLLSDEDGRPVKTEYFTRGGRLVYTEFIKYHLNGERKLITVLDPDNETLYECEYNENGNIVSAEIKDGKNTVTFKAEYHENGAIKSYTEKKTDENGAYVSTPLEVTFNEHGKVTRHGDFYVHYATDGYTVTSSKKGNIAYKFDTNGNVTEKTDSTDIHNIVTAKYTYDEQGRISIETAKTSKTLQYSYIYSYEKDGSYTVEKLGLNRKKDAIVKYDSFGLLISNEKYVQGELVTSKLTFKYNPFGEVTKIESYYKTQLNGTSEYTYDRHGDLIAEKTTGAFGEAHNKYTYFENGKIQSITALNSQGSTTQKIEYFENGNVRTTSYKSDGYVSQTATENGKIIETEVLSRGTKTKQTFEYFENGDDKCICVYVNNVLTEKAEYREDGKPIEIVTTDENGVATRTQYTYYDSGAVKSMTYSIGQKYSSATDYLENGNVDKIYTLNEYGIMESSEYIRENGVPVRINTYIGMNLSAYTLLEYFTYESDKVNNPKSIRTYDTKDNLILNMEYAKITTQTSPGYVYALVKEEGFENGELIAYHYAEYSEINGNIKSSRTQNGNKYTETTYSTSRKGEIIDSKDYIDGVLVSHYEYVADGAPYAYMQHFYGENGKPEYTLYYNYYNAPEPLYERSYEYDENGKLIRDTLSRIGGGVTSASEITEYGEDGEVVKKIEFRMNTSTNKPYYKTETVFGKGGLILRVTEYEMYSTSTDWGIEKDDVREYSEDGKLIKKVVTEYGSKGTASSTLTEEYDSEGRVIHSISERSSVKEENFFTYSESGELIAKEYYLNDVLKEKFTKEFDENGKLIREFSINGSTRTERLISYNSLGLQKEIIINVNGVLSSRYVYEYHKNGQVSAYFEYDGDELHREIYYDESGNIID